MTSILIMEYPTSRYSLFGWLSRFAELKLFLANSLEEARALLSIHEIDLVISLKDDELLSRAALRGEDHLPIIIISDELDVAEENDVIVWHTTDPDILKQRILRLLEELRGPRLTLLDYIHLAIIGRQTLRIDIDCDDQELPGHIFIEDGEVWSAWCGARSGIDVFARFLATEPSRLSVCSPENFIGSRNIHGWQHLLPPAHTDNQDNVVELPLLGECSDAWDNEFALDADIASTKGNEYLQLVETTSEANETA